MDINIEISKGSSIKYEYEDGKLKVDRFLNVPFVYPFNYGYIPNTLGRDKDPLDAVIICEYPILPCSSIKCKLIGALITEDESGEDNKFIFVPHHTVDIKSKNIVSMNDISNKEKEKIKYFFTHYKDLDVGKWIKVDKWVNFQDCAQMLLENSNIV